MKGLNFQYDFSSLTVSGYSTLEDFIDFKKKKYEQINPGHSGEEWYKNWMYEREHLMLPTIDGALSRALSRCSYHIIGKQGLESKYTLLIQINHYVDSKRKSNSNMTFMPSPSGGLNVGVYKGLSNMYEVKVYLVETSAPDKILATIRADYYNDLMQLGNDIGNLICKELK